MFYLGGFYLDSHEARYLSRIYGQGQVAASAAPNSPTHTNFPVANPNPALARKELVPQELEDRRLSTTYTSSDSEFDGWTSSTFLQGALGKYY